LRVVTVDLPATACTRAFLRELRELVLDHRGGDVKITVVLRQGRDSRTVSFRSRISLEGVNPLGRIVRVIGGSIVYIEDRDLLNQVVRNFAAAASAGEETLAARWADLGFRLRRVPR
jgi:hypothetical protein